MAVISRSTMYAKTHEILTKEAAKLAGVDEKPIGKKEPLKILMDSLRRRPVSSALEGLEIALWTL